MLKIFHDCFRLGLDLAVRPPEAEPPLTGTPEDSPGTEPPVAEPSGPESGEDRAAAPRPGRLALLEQLTAAERRLAARRGPEAAGTARRMVTVWLDEILIRNPWPGREAWLRRPLQSEWGEGRRGGLWFFQLLEGLNPARREDRELAVLALRCLSLGLGGCYGRAPERLDQVRRELQKRFGLGGEPPAFPPPWPPEVKTRRLLSPAGRKLLAAGAALPLLLWLAGSFSLERRLDRTTPTPPAQEEPLRGRDSLSLHGRLAAPEGPHAAIATMKLKRLGRDREL